MKARFALIHAALATAILLGQPVFGQAPLDSPEPKARIEAPALDYMPIQNGGRKKPYLVFARDTLQAISGRRHHVPTFAPDTNWDAMSVVTSIWMSPEGWEHEPLILLGTKSYRESVGLDPKLKRISFAEISSNSAVIDSIVAVQKIRQNEQNPKLTKEQTAAGDILVRMQAFETLISGAAFTVIPPTGEAGTSPKWHTVQDAGSQLPGETRALWDSMRSAYTSNPSAFGDAAAKFVQSVGEIPSADYPPAWKMELERLYTLVHPFRWAWVAYAFAALILVLGKKGSGSASYRAAWAMIGTGFALQTIGFIARILVAGRPPVTNMYESVIWVAFGTVLFAMILEGIYRCRYFLMGAAPAAMVSLFLADTQPSVLNPAINPIAPVLRDNFWLTTHVLSITLSYAAFLLALGLGHIILFKAMVRSDLAKVRPLYNYIYRAIQIGVLLLAVGVVLGAFWANYSWGRFWDWDPKETWALVALLTYIFLLHGRIAGRWGGFGLAVGSVFGFLAVLMAWYGVNFVLSAGLHSYGFGTGGLPYIIMFILADTLFVVAAIWRHKTRPENKKKLAEETRENDNTEPNPGALSESGSA